MRSMEWIQLTWRILHGSILIGDEEVISLSHAKVYVFSDSVLCPGTMNEFPHSNTGWVDKLTWFKSSSEYRALDNWWWANGIRVEYFPGFTTLPLCKSKSSCLKWANHRNNLKDGLSSCRCSTPSHGDPQTMDRNANWAPNSFLCMQVDFHQEDCRSSDLDQKKSAILLMIANHNENGTESWKWWWWWWWNFQEMDTQFSVLRVHCPEERSKQRWLKIISTFLRWWRNDWNFFAQFCYSAQYFRSSFRFVWRMQRLPCKNRETCVGRTIWPIVCADTFVDENSYTFDRWSCGRRSIAKKYQERVERLSQRNRVIMFCTDAGFLTTVDVGQYFMTKDTEEFSQFTGSVVCREYTLPRDEDTSEPKGWISGNTKIGPYLKLQLVAYKVNMEWKLEFSLQTKTIVTRGSEFLMAWISW